MMFGDTSLLREWLIGGIVWQVASTLSRAGLIRLETRMGGFYGLHDSLNPRPHGGGTPMRPHKMSYKVS